MKNLKVGIVGYGNIGKKRYKNLKKIKRYNVDLKFICETSYDRNSYELNQKIINDWKEINPLELDLIIICTPTKVTEKILPFVVGKTNLLIEKPGTINLRKMKFFSELSTKNNKIFKIGYNLRYDDGLNYAKKLIDNNKVGKIYHVKITYCNGASLTNSNGVGSLIDMGTHSINLIQWLLKSTKLDIKKNLTQKNEFMNKKIVDNGFMSFVCNKAICFLHHGFCNWKNKFDLEIIGNRGLIQIDSLAKWGSQKISHGKRVLPSGKPNLYTKIFKKDNSWFNELNFVLDSMGNRKRLKQINNEGFETLKIIKLLKS